MRFLRGEWPVENWLGNGNQMRLLLVLVSLIEDKVQGMTLGGECLNYKSFEEILSLIALKSSAT